MDTFVLKIKMGNAAMQTLDDIAAALHDAAERIARDDLATGRVRDVNGNTVGQWVAR
jgi:hypothetical protein